MKKFISICLTVMFLMNMCPLFTFASQVESDTFEEQTGLFMSLGVLTEGEIPAADARINRGTFVKYLLRLTDSKEMISDNTTMFWDVNSSNDYFNAVNTAAMLGFVNGNTDGSFEPYAYIESVEAVSMVLNVLGYGNLVKVKGDYPVSVHTVAARLDIDGVLNNGKDYFDFESMLNLFYDALDAYTCEDYLISDDSISFSESEETLLEKYRNIEKFTGTAYYTNISVYADSMRDLYMGKTLIHNIPAKFDNCAGYDVELWALNENGKYTFVYMMKSVRNSAVEVDFDDLGDIGYSEISYFDGSKTKTLKLNADTKYVYNGAEVDFSKYSHKDIFSADYGKAVFINNDGSTGYDCVVISVYDTVAVKYFDAEKEMLYDRNSANCSIDLTDCSYYEIFDLSGNQMYEIAAGTVVTAMKSLDGKYVKMIVSDKTVSGTIESVDSDGYLYINGEKYSVTKELFAYGDENLLKAGTEGVFGLDMNGRIACVTAGGASRHLLGFMTAAGTEGTLSATAKVKIYTQENYEYVIYPVASTVRIDGRSLKDGEEIIKALKGENNEFTPIPVAYDLNESGEVTYIDTPVKNSAYEDDNTLVQRWDGDSSKLLFYKESGGNPGDYYKMNFGGAYVATEGKFIISIGPEENWDDLTPCSQLKVDISYEVDVYSFSEDSPLVDIILVKGQNQTSADPVAYVFEEATRIVDPTEKYDYLISIQCWNGASASALTITPEYEYLITGENVISEDAKTNMTSEEITECGGLDVGDIFRIARDAKGNVTLLEKLYDYESERFINVTANSSYKNQTSLWSQNKNPRYALGTVYSLSDSYARFWVEDTDISDPDLDSKLETIYAATYGWEYTVDRSGLKISATNASTEYAGAKYGEDVKVFIQSEYTRPRQIYFIKK